MWVWIVCVSARGYTGDVFQVLPWGFLYRFLSGISSKSAHVITHQAYFKSFIYIQHYLFLAYLSTSFSLALFYIFNRSCCDPMRKQEKSLCHLCFCIKKKQLCPQIMLLFRACDSRPLSRGHSPVFIISLPLTPSGRHLITEQGTSQCFLITLPPPSGHHLMMKNLLQEVRAFVVLLFSSFLFSSLFLLFPWMCVFVCLSHSTHSTDIWCPELQCLYSTPAVTASCVSGATSPQLSLLVTVKAESITESAQGEGEIQGQLHFLLRTQVKQKNKTSRWTLIKLGKKL